MATKDTKGRIGSSFDSFLVEQGMLEEVEALAIKEIIAGQLTAAMKELGLTKVEMAQRMDTTRAQLDRLLDGSNSSVTLNTLQRAARAVGRSLAIELR